MLTIMRTMPDQILMFSLAAHCYLWKANPGYLEDIAASIGRILMLLCQGASAIVA